MMELVLNMVSAAYTALSAFVIALMTFAPIMPHWASLALSFAVGATAAVIGWTWRQWVWRVLRGK
jgi:hypothetical protein